MYTEMVSAIPPQIRIIYFYKNKNEYFAFKTKPPITSHLDNFFLCHHVAGNLTQHRRTKRPSEPLQPQTIQSYLFALLCALTGGAVPAQIRGIESHGSLTPPEMTNRKPMLAL